MADGAIIKLESASSPLARPLDAYANLKTFYDLGALDESLGLGQWTMKDEIAALIEIAKGTSGGLEEVLDPKVRMAAMDRLRELRNELLKMHGFIATGRQTRTVEDEEGNTIHQDVEAVRLIQPTLVRTEAMLRRKDHITGEEDPQVQVVKVGLYGKPNP